MFSAIQHGPKAETELAKQGKAEGLAEGAAEGRAEIILELLVTRFGPLTNSTRTRVRGAAAAQLHAVAKRVLTAQSLEEALDSI